jgi:hypothetical protein
LFFLYIQHRDAGLSDDLVEQWRIYFQRLTDGAQRCFASAAASRIRQMLDGNAVLATTGLAGSNDGHEDLQANVPSHFRMSFVDPSVSSPLLGKSLPGVQ